MKLTVHGGDNHRLFVVEISDGERRHSDDRGLDVRVWEQDFGDPQDKIRELASFRLPQGAALEMSRMLTAYLAPRFDRAHR